MAAQAGEIATAGQTIRERDDTFMNEFHSYLTQLSNIIGDHVEDVVTNPLFWVMLFLLIGCLVLTYSGTAHSRLSSSIVNTIRQFGAFLIDTFNSIVQAIKSLFGLLDVLRLLFFGHLGRSTLYVLTNYAIIFLSMASFATTLQGLYSLIGWTGILVSFGIQVMELVATMSIIICWIPPWAKLKENVRYTHISAGVVKDCCKKAANSLVSQTAKDETLLREAKEEESKEEKTGIVEGIEQRKEFLWGKVRRKVLPIALLFAYLSSIVFSYCYMFDAIVMPGIAYDDYIESIDLVNSVTEAFEDELTEYRTELVNGLTRFNSDVSDFNRLAENDISTIDSRIQSLESEETSAWNGVQAAWEAFSGLDQNDPNYEAFYQIYEAARQRYDNIQTQLSELRTSQNGAAYVLYQAIQLLTQYYADPLYLAGNADTDSDEAAAETRLNEAFNVVMIQGYGPYANDIAANPENIRTAFNNYTMLCRYYAEHGGTGLNLARTGEGDSVESLLAQRAEILAAYVELKERQETSSDTEAELRESASNYLNGETGKLLIAAMRALEDVPRFSVVGELWTDLTAKEPSITGHLQDLNEKYRAASRQLSLQERAFSKLISPHWQIAWFSLIGAAFLDGMIIFLCFLRGREYYANNIRNQRQMISLLFVNSNTKAEQEESERGRRTILMGTVLGCFVYLLYFRFYPDTESRSALIAFVLIIAGILLMALLSSLRSVFQKKTDYEEENEDKEGKEKEERKEDEKRNANKGKQKTPVEERLFDNIYVLLTKKLQKDWFYKRCTVRRPKTAATIQGAKEYLRDKNIFRSKEDHRIRTHVFGKNDYDIIVTSCDKNMEYYILDDDINEAGLTFQFAVLKSQRLAYHVVVPLEQAEDSTSKETDENQLVFLDQFGKPTAGRRAHLLTEEFIRLLYESIMLRTIAGNNWEYSMEDDLLDYEREDDDEGD